MCDSTSNDQERLGPDGAELEGITGDDVKLMDKAKEAAMQSHDEQTKASLINFNDGANHKVLPPSLPPSLTGWCCCY